MSKKTINTYYCDLCGKKLSSNVENMPMIVLGLTIMATTFIL